jgi:glycosyltransferase involved in cell wall biosynthesis
LKTFPLHGALIRAGGRIRQWTLWSSDPFLHSLFSRWAARQLRRESSGPGWDAIYSFSGISEDILREPLLKKAFRLVVRGSAHIRAQAEILAREEKRAGCRLDRPSQWMIEREEREYSLADAIVVLSTFAANSFLAAGVPAARLRLLPLGTETKAFRPGPDVIEARRARILSGAPLCVLYVGNVSYQKGLADYCEIVKNAGGRFRFRIVGTVTSEAQAAISEIRDRIELVNRRPQNELPEQYNIADLFIFPTLQDGYAVVLAQASAAGLPILATSNCSAPDLVREGQTGWVLPIREPEAFLRRLEWCDAHREELAGMVTAAWMDFRTRDWSDVAADFEEMCRAEIVVRSGDRVSAATAGMMAETPQQGL